MAAWAIPPRPGVAVPRRSVRRWWPEEYLVGETAVAAKEGPKAKPLDTKKEVTKNLNTEEENFVGATALTDKEGPHPKPRDTKRR